MKMKRIKMKTIISLVIFLTLQVANAQTKNLEFNRVIDTILKVEITSCTDIYNNPAYSAVELTVPSGKVWKVTSLGSEGLRLGGYLSSSADNHYYTRFSCSSSSSGTYAVACVIKLQGSEEYELLTNSYVSEEDERFRGGIEYPIWLNSLTILKAKMYSKSSSLNWTNSDYLPYVYKAHVSLIEFNIAQ